MNTGSILRYNCFPLFYRELLQAAHPIYYFQMRLIKLEENCSLLLLWQAAVNNVFTFFYINW